MPAVVPRSHLEQVQLGPGCIGWIGDEDGYGVPVSRFAVDCWRGSEGRLCPVGGARGPQRQQGRPETQP